MEEFEKYLNEIINNNQGEFDKIVLIMEMIDKIPEEELTKNTEKIICEFFNINIDKSYKRIFLNQIASRLPKENIEKVLVSIFSIDSKIISSQFKVLCVSQIIDLLDDNELKENVEAIIKIILNTDKEEVLAFEKPSLVINIIKKLPKEIQMEKIDAILNEIISGHFSEWNKEYIIENTIKILNQEVVKNKLDTIIEKIVYANVENMNKRSKKVVVDSILRNASEDVIDYKVVDIVKTIINANEELLDDTGKEQLIEDIIDKLPEKNLEENIKKILEVNQKNSDVLYSILIKKAQKSKSVEALKEIPEDKLDESIDYDSLPKWADLIEEMLKNERHIMQSDFIMHIYNQSQNSIETRTEEDKKAIKNIRKAFKKFGFKYPTNNKKREITLNKINFKNSIFNMSNLDTKVLNFEKMSQEEFDGFIKNIEFLKIKNGKIPEKYCDYIIWQKLISGKEMEEGIYSEGKSDINIDKYLYIVKRAFEDKIIHLLEKEGIFGYTVKFAKLETYECGNTEPLNKVIHLNLDNLIDMNIENASLINSMFHEIEHAKQNAYIQSKDMIKMDGIKYNMIKEKFIKQEDENFYNANYIRMYEEIGARIEGSREQSKYLLYLGFSPEQIISTDKTKLQESFKKAKKIEMHQLERAQNKVGNEAEIISISQKFMEIFMKKDPDTIEFFLKRFPALQLEFDKDGIKKTIAEMFEEINNNEELSESQINIYMEIFKENIQFDFRTVIKDLKTITQYKKYNNIDADLMNNFIEQIIKNEILTKSNINRRYSTIDFDDVLKILSKFATENPNLSVSNWILEQIEEYQKTGNLKQDEDYYKEDEMLKLIVSKRKVEIIKKKYSDKINSINEFQNMLKDFENIETSRLDFSGEITYFAVKKIDYNKIDATDVIRSIYEMKIVDNEEIRRRRRCVKDISMNLPIEVQKRKLGEIFDVIMQNEGTGVGGVITKYITDKLKEKNVNIDDDGR